MCRDVSEDRGPQRNQDPCMAEFVSASEVPSATRTSVDASYTPWVRPRGVGTNVINNQEN
jgi:hypothetical protein